MINSEIVHCEEISKVKQRYECRAYSDAKDICMSHIIMEDFNVSVMQIYNTFNHCSLVESLIWNLVVDESCECEIDHPVPCSHMDA